MATQDARGQADRVSLNLFLSILFCSTMLSMILPLTTQVNAAAPITSSGLNTQVNLSTSASVPAGKTQYDITGGTRPGGGTNLFHSFGDFNVPTNNIANFLNDSGLPTSNILGRVTGGTPSSIFWMIETTGFGSANLFLMNPAGFLFGPNAALNVGGMVAFTTADYLRLADGVRFNAISDAAADAVLSLAPVAAFGFLGSNPAAIAVQGSTLQVADRQTLSMVGGNKGFTATDPDTGNPINVPGGFTMSGGKLLAPGGQINIASVAGPGVVSAVDVMSTTGMTMGNIRLSQGALVDVSADTAGTVRIRGGQLIMDDATISADTVDTSGAPVAVDINLTSTITITDSLGAPAITARTAGAGDAGGVVITSANLTATTSTPDGTIHTLIDTHSSGAGAAGTVTITTGDLHVTGPDGLFFFIDSGVEGSGRGGNVNITAHTIELSGTTISTGTQRADIIPEFPDGNAGNLTINAHSLLLNNGHLLTLADSDLVGFTQQAGQITLNVQEITTLNNTSVNSQGLVAGGMTINADTLFSDASTFLNFSFFGSPGQPGPGLTFNGRVLELTNGTTWSTSTFGDIAAGDIRVTATDHVSLIGVTGTNPLGGFNPSGLFSNSFGGFGNGPAGNIIVTTPKLTMEGGRINSSTSSSGRGGNVTINAGLIDMSGEFPNATTGDFFFGIGNVRPSGIVTQTVGTDACVGPCGDAGNITVTTGSLIMGPGSQINSGTTNNGQGGNISIQATDTISMSGTLTDGSPVGVFSRSVGGTPNAGSGGSIVVTAGQSITITNSASVSASTTGPGNAGNILVKANDVAINGGGTITAGSSGAGNAGTVAIEGTSSPAYSFIVDGVGSGIFTNTEDTGAGGNIFVEANAVTLQNGGTVSASTSGTSSSATGGNISISGGQFVQMNNGASITASSTGPGNAGNILIDAGPQLIMQSSSIKTEAAQAGGGNIEIRAVDVVQLGNSTVSTSVLGGTGSGGNITIDPNFVLLQNSRIIAQAVQGAGGNISITTNLLMPDSTSLISASSQFGQQGTIIIQSPVSPASGKLIPLGQKPLIATSLLSQRCAAIAGGSISSFTVAGRDSLPAEPGGWLSSPVALSMSESEEGTVRETNGSMLDEFPLLSLRKIAPSGFLTQAFAVESSGCQS